MLIILFLILHFYFLFVPSGRLSWLPVSFYCTLYTHYCIVSYVWVYYITSHLNARRGCACIHSTAGLRSTQPESRLHGVSLWRDVMSWRSDESRDLILCQAAWRLYSGGLLWRGSVWERRWNMSPTSAVSLSRRRSRLSTRGRHTPQLCWLVTAVIGLLHSKQR